MHRRKKNSHGPPVSAPAPAMPPPAQAASPAQGRGELAALDARKQKHDAEVARLERIIASSAEGTIKRSRALVELAQLKEQEADVEKLTSRQKTGKELDSLKDRGEATKLKTNLEYAILKHKEDKVRHELEIQHQLLELRDRAALDKDRATKKRKNAAVRAEDAAAALVARGDDVERAKEALKRAERARETAESTKRKRGDELERAIASEEHHLKDLIRLKGETEKNDAVIRQKLRKAGLNEREMDIIYDNNSLTGRAQFEIFLDVVGDSSGEGRKGESMPAKNKVSPQSVMSYEEKKMDADDFDLDADEDANVAKRPRVNVDGLVANLGKHRTAQEEHLKGLQKEVTRLNDKVAKAEWAELIELRKAKPLLEKELGESKKQVATLESNNADHRATIQTLETDGEEKQVKILELADKSIKFGEQNQALKNEKLSLENTVSYLNLRLENMEKGLEAFHENSMGDQSKLMALQKNSSSQGETILRLEKDKRELQNTIAELNLQIHGLEKDMDALEKAGAKQQKKILELVDKGLNYGEKVMAMEDGTKGLENTITALNLQIRGLEKSIESLYTDCETKENRIKELEQEMKDKKAHLESLHIESLRADSEGQQQRIDELEEQKRTLRSRYNELEKKMCERKGTIDDQIHSLREECEAKQARILQLEDEKHALGLKYGALEERVGENISSLGASIEALRADCKRKEEKIVSLEEDKRAISERYAGLEAKVEEKIASFDDQLDEIRAERDQKQAQIMSLVEKGLRYGETILKLEEEKGALKKSVAYLNDRIDGLENNVDILEAECKGKQEKIEAVEWENAQWAKRIFTLEDKKSSLENTVADLLAQYSTLEVKVEEKVSVLGAGLEEVKMVMLSCQRRTAMVCSHLGEVRQQREVHYTNVERLRRRIEYENQQLVESQQVLHSLEEMKMLLEYRKSMARARSEKRRVEEMMKETAALLEEKERGSRAIQVVKNSYETSMWDKLEILELGVIVERAREMLKATDAELATRLGMPATKIQWPKKDEETAPRPRRRPSSPGSGMDAIDRVLAGPAREVEIAELHQKLDAMRKEKEELSKRVKPERYQLSCKLDGCTSDIVYKGKTRKRLVNQLFEHFDDVWELVQQGAKAEGSDISSLAEHPDGTMSHFAKSSFAKHMAKHCRHAKSKDEAVKICQKYVKVHRQSRQEQNQKQTKGGFGGLVSRIAARSPI